ncbi:unnamed protein product [Discosporangium mesarthrocarpum]
MIQNIFKYLANLKLAIIILLLIAIVSSVGSIIEQNKDIEFYQNNYSNLIINFPVWQIIFFFGLNNIYNTWWFLSLLFLFGFSLISCTFFQQLPTLKFSRRFYFYKQPTQFNKLDLKFQGNKVLQSHLGYNLLVKQYSFFQQYNTIYAYKGLISRIGPIIVHLSIICILLGSTFGALTGFNAQELVPKTEIFHIQNLIKTGIFSSVPQKTFRINDFWSIYNQNGLIKQFYSDISILNGNGFEIKRKTISVNTPLINNELIIYQTDWGIMGLRFNSMNKNINSFQIPVSKLNNSNQKIWITWLPNKIKNQEGFIILIKNNRGQITVYNKNGKFIKNINVGENIMLNNLITLNFIDFISSTGIQIKSDPGIKFIYFGFLFLIISSIISYISFSELWLLFDYKKIFFGGKTNRAKIKFNIEFLQFQQFLIKK